MLCQPQRHHLGLAACACGVVVVQFQPAVGVQRFAHLLQHAGLDGGRQQRLAGGHHAHFVGPFALQAGGGRVRAGVRWLGQVALRLRKKSFHGLHQPRRQQVPQVFVCQLQQQRFLRAQVGHRQAGGVLQPAVAVGFAALVALDAEMLAEHFQLALDGAQVAFKAGVFQLAVQLAGGDLAPAWNAAQQFHHQQRGVQGVRALGHGNFQIS